MRLPIRVVVAALAVTLLASCTGYRHNQWRDARTGSEDNGAYSLRIIEADDEGWFWQGAQANSSIELIREKVKQKNTIVLMFVHGWHHSAECCDPNVEGFRSTLDQLSVVVPDFNIVGIYVGWRGRSLPGFLDYFTFWGRKSAAERVGQNDLKEFIGRLQQLYIEFRADVCIQQQQTNCAQPGSGNQNFLGLVTLGHSFGAQVLLKGVNGSLEDRLQQLNPQPAYLRGARPARPDPAHAHSLSGIGDLMVLINPAAEASQYHRLHLLSQGLNYSQLQSPVMLVVSSENDKARHRLFTLGRWMGEVFTGKPRKDDDVQRVVERQALGVYAGHVTHQLNPVDPQMVLTGVQVQRRPDQCDSSSFAVDWLKWRSEPTVTRPNSLVPNDPKLRAFDFSGNVAFNGVALAPLTLADVTDNPLWKDYGVAQPYQPLIVAKTSRHIIDDHSGIFTTPFLQFLVPYIAYIEEKSKLNVAENYKVREQTEQAMESSKQ